jgi:hypothetical protein
LANTREENERRFPGFARFVDSFREAFPKARVLYVENLHTGDRQGRKPDGTPVVASVEQIILVGKGKRR